MWAAPPPNRFTKVIGERHLGELDDQPSGIVVESICVQEDVDPRPPVVIPGNLVV
jgi:hypothetical protein